MAKKYKQKPGNGKVTVDLPGGEYLISEETTDNGIIILTCIPTSEKKKEFQSKLDSIQAELNNAQDQKAYIQAVIDDLQAQKADIKKIVDTL